ncbi:MAG: TonB system transport protein ExbD [Methylobacteriaceae bacterium]|nr:TonB system transport protein ExbD [Methylobacteriaceae bacterium]
MAGSIADIENEDEFSEAHEINVTPFIDVILVLLIIFMVAAPLSTVDLPVDLPSSAATPQKKPDKPVYITVKSDLSVAIGETPVKRRDLARTLETMPEAGKDTRLFLRADRAVPYGELMQVLELLRHGGFLKVALVALEGVPESANLPPTDPAPAAAPSVAAPPQ